MCTTINIAAGQSISGALFHEKVTVICEPQIVHVNGIWGAIKLAWQIKKGKPIYGQAPLIITNNVFPGSGTMLEIASPPPPSLGTNPGIQAQQ